VGFGGTTAKNAVTARFNGKKKGQKDKMHRNRLPGPTGEGRTGSRDRGNYSEGGKSSLFHLLPTRVQRDEGEEKTESENKGRNLNRKSGVSATEN